MRVRRSFEAHADTTQVRKIPQIQKDEFCNLVICSQMQDN